MLKAKRHRSSMFSATPAEQSLVMELLSCRLTEITQQCSHFSDHTGHSPPHDSCLPRSCQELDTSEDGQTAALPVGPSLDLHNSPAQRASRRCSDIIRHRNTLLIWMTSAVSSVHLCGLVGRSSTGCSEEEANFVIIC